MSNVVAYPIWSGNDISFGLKTAYRVVDGPGCGRLDEIVLQAETQCLSGIRRYLSLFESSTVALSLQPEEHVRIMSALNTAGVLPVWHYFRNGRHDVGLPPFDSVVSDLLEQVGVGSASLYRETNAAESPAKLAEIVNEDCGGILWWLDEWPAVRDVDLPLQRRQAGVQLTMNSTDIQLRTRDAWHALFVLVGAWPGEEERARWIAEQVGATIIGPGVGY